MAEARVLMIQGTGSDVGKSVLVAGLCRVCVRRGIRVIPFKPQNMSNNAAVAEEGGEIGRAQALQARAAGLVPSVHMNPVLLKPESDRRTQVVVQGRVHGRLEAKDFLTGRGSLLPKVMESFALLKERAELVLVEGAGSASEVNLRERDIANMGFARAAHAPVVIAGDIDRGGVIASLVGTHAVLDPDDRALVRGFLVNKLRGEPRLFDAGVRAIEAHTGWRSFGVLPWVRACSLLPAEDAVVLERDAGQEARTDRLLVAVPMLSRISNFDDLDPLAAEPGVEVVMVPPGRVIPAEAKLVVLPGTKATLADLDFLRAQGWDIDLAAHVRRGGHVLGLCGGYQLLGNTIADPHGVEGPPEQRAGLGLLDVYTKLGPDKRLHRVTGRHLDSGTHVTGYEIHVGETTGPDCERPMFELDGSRLDGATSRDGRVLGSYVHGLFESDDFRRRFLARFDRVQVDSRAFAERVESALDALASAMEEHLDIDALLSVAR